VAARLRDSGLGYDLLVRSPQLPAAFETARALPDLRLVIDHLAKPRIAACRVLISTQVGTENARAPGQLTPLPRRRLSRGGDPWRSPAE